MVKIHSLWFSCFFFLLWTTLDEKANATLEERKIYIVYMGALPNKEYSASIHHVRLLKEAIGGSSPECYLIRSYTKSFNGFAANLTEKESQKLTGHKEVVSIFPSKNLKLLTTESWDFTGMPLNLSRSLPLESDIIIGFLDSGIWPESESFSDHGLGPIPKKWNGTCDGGQNFTCNRKIVGARHYSHESARDIAGHGSHTASIAAGNVVANTSFCGIAGGSVRGGVPSARIAVYRICASLICTEHDILAAFDDAIADGVDILSLSIGSNEPLAFERDVLAIGCFHAAAKGILAVNSAGNNGFVAGLTHSTVPWLFSVAASSTKRRIVNKVSLGNGVQLHGHAINTFKLEGTNFPLIYGSAAAKEECHEIDKEKCSARCLDEKKVKGKIVICSSSEGFKGASRAGAVGAVAEVTLTDVSFLVPLPASLLTKEQFEILETYYNSTKNPLATIFTSETIENEIAPGVASFSSRGPNKILPDILKPDITAPGVDILAAYSPADSPPYYYRSVNFSFLTGTSMSCPHVAGASAYVKSWHPDWSPSAIKSALMTTAWPMNATKTTYGDAEFSYGAGHIDPVKALNPGLVYETLREDYVELICSMGFDNETLGKIIGDNTTCPQRHILTPKNLNYPSMSARVADRSKGFLVKFPRIATNVGVANSTYKAIITATPECNITVKPNILSFQALKERRSFVVTVAGRAGVIGSTMISASLKWSDGVHSVRSPIVIYD